MKKYTNGSIATPIVVDGPAAQRSEAEQREAERSAAAGPSTTRPDPEAVPRAKRRQYPAEYKKRILAEADAAREPGAIGALLRREGLYSSHLTHWRQQRDAGLAPQQRGPKPKHDPLFEEVRKLKMLNDRLAKRLAHAELIIDVQKKVSLLLGIPLATVDSHGSNS
jgi:transposase-like protein